MNLNGFFKKFGINSKNISLYERAFTHSSFNAELNTTNNDYESLEFIGDSVVGFIVSTLIFKYHPSLTEGDMTKMKIQLVQSKSLAEYSLKLGLDKYIRAGHSLTNEEARNNQHILEDIFEAVMGAIYLDQGFDFINKLLTKIFEEDIKNFEGDRIIDYKSMLQEYVQAESRKSVIYSIIEESGPAHDKTFVANVIFNDIVLGRGVGKTKKEAEQHAAKDALSKKAS